MTELFLSATYNDQRDCVEEVKSKLAELGVSTCHFKEGEFYNGRIDIHSHDRCIELVEQIPNYLLIVSYRAGAFYEGINKNYSGLTVTHSEFKAALNATKKDPNRRLYLFVRKEVWYFFNYWKDLVIKKQYPENWEIDRNLFPLLRDLETLSWTDTFDTSLDLKEMISKKVGYFA
ncbi:DUF4062 domain-containing protein [bacterium]|nr:DUF4062 domain-containing protein [bacterium]